MSVSRAGLWTLVVVAVSICSLTSSAMAQRPGGGRPGGPGGPGGFGGFGGLESSLIGLLRIDEVKKDLELVGDQEAKLTDLGEKIAGQMREAFQGGGANFQTEEGRAAFRERFEKQRADTEAELKKILLPQQWDRLKQIQLQAQLRSRGTGILGSEEISQELGITEEQREKLQTARDEMEKNLTEQIAKLRQEAQQKVLDVLTTEQKAKWQKMIGDPIELPDPQRGGFQFNRGGGGPQGRAPSGDTE